MAYDFYMGKMQLPVPPSKLTVKIGNNNKTITLINTGEVNILKLPKLTEIEFEAEFPNVPHAYAAGEAIDYLNTLESMKVENQKFQFIVNRSLPDGTPLFDTNMKVTLEEYSIKEDAGNGFNVIAAIKLKQYKPYGTQKLKVSKKKNSNVKKKATKKKTRNAKTVKQHTYKVKNGDCLWNIAKKEYGDGSLWKKIYKANKSKIKNPNSLSIGTVLKIPAK